MWQQGHGGGSSATGNSRSTQWGPPGQRQLREGPPSSGPTASPPRLKEQGPSCYSWPTCLFTLHAVWRARTNWRFHGTYPPPTTHVVALNTLKLLSFTTTTAFRKDADKFRRAAFSAELAQVVIEDDFSVVL